MLAMMIKGIDYPGINITFFCHDGVGNYLMHQRTDKCRDEHWTWDFGGGGLKMGESLADGVRREIEEEYLVTPLSIEFLGFREVHRIYDGKPTHWIAFDHRVLVDRNTAAIGEPEKMAQIGWFRLDALPDPLHSQIHSTIEKNRSALLLL